MDKRQKAIIEAAEKWVASIAETNFLSYEAKAVIDAVNMPDFKKGQLVMVKDKGGYEYKHTFNRYDESNGDCPYHAGNAFWQECRHPTDEEWKQFREGE